MTRRSSQPRTFDPRPPVVDPATKPPPRVVHVDHRGREWTVTYLFKSISSYGETRWNDATHRGFAWKDVRAVYRFREGDDRSNDPCAIAAQFAAAGRISTPLERVTRSVAKPAVIPTNKDERMQELYSRRGMGRR